MFMNVDDDLECLDDDLERVDDDLEHVHVVLTDGWGWEGTDK